MSPGLRRESLEVLVQVLELRLVVERVVVVMVRELERGLLDLELLLLLLLLLLELLELLLLLLEPLLRNERGLGCGLRTQAMSRLQSPEGPVRAGRGWRVELHRCWERAKRGLGLGLGGTGHPI